MVAKFVLSIISFLILTVILVVPFASGYLDGDVSVSLVMWLLPVENISNWNLIILGFYFFCLSILASMITLSVYFKEIKAQEFIIFHRPRVDLSKFILILLFLSLIVGLLNSTEDGQDILSAILIIFIILILIEPLFLIHFLTSRRINKTITLGQVKRLFIFVNIVSEIGILISLDIYVRRTEFEFGPVDRDLAYFVLLIFGILTNVVLFLIEVQDHQSNQSLTNQSIDQ